MISENNKNDGAAGEANFRRDPTGDVSGTPPIRTGMGPTAGGPVGGGLVGKEMAKKIDPTVEDAYWQSNYANRPYVEKSKPYEAYRPAYRAGYEGYVAHAGKSFEEAEEDLQQRYYSNRDKSDLEWIHARHASRDAWERVESQHANTKSGGEGVP
ncbi:MAG: hypothetical protein JWM04_2348 [Verrucomicrobiales bacterium]|nr:hypothetical protein [Verrucomicrobiales bacterium]